MTRDNQRAKFTPRCVAAALVLTALLCALPLTSGKGIHVTVEASWNETAYLQEGCEWAGRTFGARGFYACLHALWERSSSSDVDARVSTQQAQYNAVREVVQSLADSYMADTSLFTMEMAARVYSPAVEAHYATAAQVLHEVAVPSTAAAAAGITGEKHDATTACTCGEPFGVVYARALAPSGEMGSWQVCSAGALQAVRTSLQAHLDAQSRVTAVPTLSASEVALGGFDHLYPGSPAGNATAVLVLYGLIGSSTTKALHTTAMEWVQANPSSATTDAGAGGQPTLAYIFRHLPVSRTRLCGFAAPISDGSAAAAAAAAVSVSEQWDSPMVVQGYGVTVDIKSTEYKVLDEKAAAAREEATETSGDGAQAALAGLSERVVGGLHLRRLSERYPQHAAALSELATQLGDDAGSEEVKVNFDVWELQNIGLAATEYIRAVENNSRRLHVLKDMVNRFPRYATALSRLAAQQDRLEAVQKTLTTTRLRLPAGASALFVDGWRVEEKDLSLFGVFDALRADEAVSRDVKRIVTTRVLPSCLDDEEEEGGTAAAAAAAAAEQRAVTTARVEPDLLQKVSGYVKRAVQRAEDAAAAGGGTGASATTSDAAFAVPAAYITWLNDVETEAHFEGMSKKLTTFFTQAPGVTPFPRRNLLNYIFIWNPLLKSHLQMLTLIYRFNRQGLVARFGLLLLDPEWSPVIAPESGSLHEGRSSLSEDVLAVSAIAYHLKAAGQPDLMLDVLVQLLQTAVTASSSAPSDAIPSSTVQQVCERVADAMLGATLEELMADVEFLAFFHETQEVIRRFPMADYPAALLNGVVVDLAGGQLSLALQEEVNRLRQWVATEALTDDMTNLYEDILRVRGAADHIQPALLRPPQAMSWASSPALVGFVESAPYLYSASYAMDVPSLTQIVTLPCQVTTATLRQLQTVLTALEGCAAVSDAADVHFAVCRRLRVSVVTCPTAATTDDAAAAAESLTAASAGVAEYVVALLRLMAHRDIAETKRFKMVQRYVAHILAALDALPSSTATTSEAISREMVSAALARLPLPADLQVKTSGRPWSGQTEFWAALAASAASVRDTTITLITNGRVIAMDDTFVAADVLDAARQVLPLTSMVEEAVLKINFAEMTPAGVKGGFTAEEMDNAFYSGKVACLTTVFNEEKLAHASGTSASVIAREEALFMAPEDRKRLRTVTFTVNNTPTTPTSGAVATGAVSGDEDGDGTVGAQPASRGEHAGLHQITAVVDPSSRDAQLIVSLVAHLLQSPLHLRLTVLLNPSLDVKFPIRDFYEYVATPAARFDEATGRVEAPAASFAQLPSTALLTLGVEEPPTWTVFSHAAEEDLDNILLSKLSPGRPFVEAVYRMHSLLVTGDATDSLVGGPPDGLPLSLAPAFSRGRGDGGEEVPAADSNTHSTDTQVMANQNGYYQLQAVPGLWLLSVKPGPLAAAYCVEAVGNAPRPECLGGRGGVNFTEGQRIPVMVDSFSGRYLSLRVRQTPQTSSRGSGGQRGSSAGDEKLHEILQSLATNVKHTWPPSWLSRGAKPHPPERPTLNIFSVASGHLYERFLRMMFFSVHKTSSDKFGANTTRIKFWVIENFLSPQFKRYIPRLATELGFEVGFVTYRWPWWLPRQTEKQRKIWAYKILFLDVLFPLDVDRIIFVDADQTAQADLHELYNMDIGRSPVAMTPFCQMNRNEDTVRFRFWEHGFWVDHLKGKPYHISAIFLVDLRQFRAMRAGDRYRATYAGLAGDPNSLANLDQDLPNYLQASIPIFSLPEQWLWCETWCSAKSKSKAKTIDLCNNPLTKMPKLDNAKMVIPDWETQDNYLQNLSDSLLAHL